jgi:hypothetical protein
MLREEFMITFVPRFGPPRSAWWQHRDVAAAKRESRENRELFPQL